MYPYIHFEGGKCQVVDAHVWGSIYNEVNNTISGPEAFSGRNRAIAAHDLMECSEHCMP